MATKKSKRSITAGGVNNERLRRTTLDLTLSDPVDLTETGQVKTGLDRLTFDGYSLVWHGADPATYTAFSGLADESANESAKDEGPVPQGKYALEPNRIEKSPPPATAWGARRVALEPYKATVDRMKDCFGLIRTNMYIHGGQDLGTIGCIEINDDTEEKAFFDKLAAYGKRIELEVRYSGDREKKYEDPRCPY